MALHQPPPVSSAKAAIIVCGFIACDLRPFNPPINALPRLLHLPAEGVGAWVAPMPEHAASESGGRRAGRGALRDRQVGCAITLMHGDPAEPWILKELGQRVDLSRSALHERFVALTGLAPMQYLANWRMQCDARLLRESYASVAAVALEVGYDSEAAFSRAFKRANGLPPGAWRRTQLQPAGKTA